MPAGQPKNVKTPEAMLKHWEDYKASLEEKAQDWEKIQYVGKDGDKKTDYPKLPLTLEGFKVFCWNTNIGTVE